MDLAERARRFQDYVAALEEERRKILVFQRELPLCLQLVTDTIESVQQQMESMGSEETVSGGPVLEEFIPLKPSFYSSSDEEENAQEDRKKMADPLDLERAETKPDWLRSVQLWNQAPEPAPPMEPPRKPVAVNVRRVGGAFHPFEREKPRAPLLPTSSAPAASTTSGGSGGSSASEKDREKDREKEKEGQSQPHRKVRRSWSPELHRRFLQALQQLGGSDVATPKQIRELMKVDGLTNDEVKSHLQKYRLHTKRPSSAVQSSGNSTPPAPQFVVVGGIWVPPPDYTAAHPANVAGRPSEIYTPVASLPSELRSPQPQPQQNKRQQPSRSSAGPMVSEGRHSGDHVNSHRGLGAANSVSPTTSSSSQTTSVSHPF